MAHPSTSGPLSEGSHSYEADGITLRYHVFGTGPVCVAVPGGPGIAWEYLRSPALEQRLTMVYMEPAGTGDSGRLATHPHGYTRDLYSRHLSELIDLLPVERVHLLGHSHGGFVTQYHAILRPDQLAGIVLYESAPATDQAFGAEAARMVGELAERHAGNPLLPDALNAFAQIPHITDDESMMRVARGIIPAYVASYWTDPAPWTELQKALRATYISGLDEHGVPDSVDDRAALPALRVPALVVAGRFDVICGVRWGQELHALIPESRLLILENSGHMGHLEEPEVFAEAVAAFVSGSAFSSKTDMRHHGCGVTEN
ncbi:alpha/beta hydrolase fold protein [Catenulispora acidiphila DSM 44928]|uniref:Alpha/beta hydrolase fold protein n=1 Tax=Catenulispora acidiphila (strain DSM 44928 / JCM 14897 / NBRC 102108 / NRRL B-24433 / ID139908) TaxID=479433 RepID=C7Q6G1_CATAD|nr:alpha/beta hydrolase [Catenulispora acidiphila]ACU73996.1 alpha/beta hydrolase fold protein [Catenulispora acidiphila DSM 44928]